MILLGAGTSVPFEIPDMKGFVEGFRKESESEGPPLHNLLVQIESALDNSEEVIGCKMPFDLESLMSVLQDLTVEDRPISLPTFAFMLHTMSRKGMEVGAYNIKDVRKRYHVSAKRLLKRLQNYVFKVCLKPIRKGQRSRRGFSFLDRFYGPLFLLLGEGIFESGQTQWVFSTNWDLCLKQWLEYARLGFQDGTQLDGQRKPVLVPSAGWSTDSVRKVVPYHGSMDLIRKTRRLAKMRYEEINKVTAPEKYFKGCPSEISKAFVIYPLEAVGYEQSVRSPYLDMLNLLKTALRNEDKVYVIGFSFRDSTIASIFDEAIRERVQRGGEYLLKIFLVTRSPETVIESLQNQGYVNLSSTLIPVKVSFPNMISNLEDYRRETSQAISLILRAMQGAGISMDASIVSRSLEKYSLKVS
jgi:hypothetical protein